MSKEYTIRPIKLPGQGHLIRPIKLPGPSKPPERLEWMVAAFDEMLEEKNADETKFSIIFNLVNQTGKYADKNSLEVPNEKLSQLGKKAYAMGARATLKTAEEMLVGENYAWTDRFVGERLRLADRYAKRAGMDVSREIYRINEKRKSKSKAE